MKKERSLGFIIVIMLIVSSFFAPLSAVFAQTETNNNAAGAEEVTEEKNDESVEEEKSQEEETEEKTQEEEKEEAEQAPEEKPETKKSKSLAQTRASFDVNTEDDLRDAAVLLSPGGTINIQSSFTVTGSAITIYKDLTIEGNDHTITFANIMAYERLFSISGNMSDIGKLTIKNLNITNSSMGHNNGGIQISGGELVIENTSFRGIDHDDGVINIGYNYSPKGKFTMISGAIENNNVASSPISNEGIVIIKGGSISNNISSSGMAGAI